jgi:hypothetical protein
MRWVGITCFLLLFLLSVTWDVCVGLLKVVFRISLGTIVLTLEIGRVADL